MCDLQFSEIQGDSDIINKSVLLSYKYDDSFGKCRKLS